ncbi:putative reductase [Candidatus Rhodobacter oscarellae]|uniref:Putative reductase n=1 Tax=Candidatus Rhodobacter oscarellae TaxID=1675527 RepID=A0A0J9E6B2_9RHOB|nr:glycine reductase [Candidatus Rhodobacter lobularis]KMW58201.1 putative reductase [Candidatus Rhodobacter lobularis]
MSAPIAYIDRTRAYYQALGYGAPYDWAHFRDVPFARLGKPLAEARIAVVTTAAPFKPGAGNQGPGAAYNAQAKFYEVYAVAAEPIPDLRISHVAIDRDHTSAEDPGTWLPLRALRSEHSNAAPLVYGLPTNRSHRQSQADAEVLCDLMTGGGVDAAILVPNCPVCHQSVCFAARALESAGIATVIMGCARDIVEHAGAPRFLFSDFPLGNAAGRPGDPDSQLKTMRLALRLLVEAEAPRTTWVSPLRWPGPPDWREDYSNPARLSPEEIAARRAAFDQGKAQAKALRGNASAVK